MEIVRFFRNVPEKLKGAALAIGNFDGVHRGHQKVLGEAIAIAKREGRRSGAVVFEPHPREFFAPETPFFRLTSLPVKLELLQALGLTRLSSSPSTRACSLSAEAFATEVVAKRSARATWSSATISPTARAARHDGGACVPAAAWLRCGCCGAGARAAPPLVEPDPRASSQGR
jgi:hypothetical protein